MILKEFSKPLKLKQNTQLPSINALIKMDISEPSTDNTCSDVTAFVTSPVQTCTRIFKSVL